ncbi:MAG: TolC family protein, partial [Candidatus Kapaibacterium sp.]
YNLSELQLSQQVSNDWMKVAAAIRHYDFYRQFDSLFVGIRKTNSARYEVQDISGLEYSITKSKSNEIANQLQISKTEVEQSIIQLNKWLPDDNMYIANANTSIGNLESTDLELNQSHLLLEYYKQNIAVSQSQLDMSYSDLYPKISGNYAIQEIQGQSGFYSYQVGISFPLIFNTVSGDIGAAEQEYMIAEQTLEMKEMEFNANYKSQLLEMKKWETSFKYYENEAMPLVIDIKVKSFQRYKGGEIDYMDFVQSIREVIDIEANYINAMKNYYNSYLNLKYYTNK